MPQTEARKTLKDAPIMWRRINSIGMILDCNSTYAANLGYAKSEILGKPIFEHVPKESWESMNNSLKIWFETGKVTDRKITFIREDKSTFSGLLQATSLYDENKNLIGSNTVIFNLTQMSDEDIEKYEEFFKESNQKLDEIKERLGGHDAQLTQIYEAIENILDENAAKNKWDNRTRIGFR